MSQKFTIIGPGIPATVALCGNEQPPLEVIGPARPAPNVNWQVQSVMPLDALVGHAIGLGNGIATIEWTVARTHASLLEAQKFVRDHPGEIPCKGICVLEWELGKALSRSVGALQSLTWQGNEMPGLRTVCTYRWVGSPFIAASLGGN